MGCGNPNCSVSISIDEVTFTFGSGRIDGYGFWQKPCWSCAQEHRRTHPEDLVWPSGPVEERPEILVGQTWIAKKTGKSWKIVQEDESSWWELRWILQGPEGKFVLSEEEFYKEYDLRVD